MNYYCAICNVEVNKYSTILSDGNKICKACDEKVRSVKVEKEIRRKDSKNDYYIINIDQMKEMQELFDIANSRAKQFIPTYTRNELCIDGEHGWFFIDRDAITYKKKLKDYQPLEIFSVGDVDLRYDIQDWDTRFDSHIYFTFKKQMPSYLSYLSIYNTTKLFESEDAFMQRVAGIWSEICAFFPESKHTTPEMLEQDELVGRYAKMKNDIYTLAHNREVTNNQIDMLFTEDTPKKYKTIAKQYLELDNLLSAELNMLLDMEKLSTATELKERKENATIYLEKMMNIYSNLLEKMFKKKKCLKRNNQMNHTKEY